MPAPGPISLAVQAASLYQKGKGQCDATRYNSHRHSSEWRLFTNLLERGVARPNRYSPISSGNESAPLTR